MDRWRPRRRFPLPLRDRRILLIREVLPIVVIVSAGTACKPQFGMFRIFRISPEQTSRSPITSAADVWALGLIAYTMLTAKMFWRAEQHEPFSMGELLREIVLDPIPSASARAAEDGRAGDRLVVLPMRTWRTWWLSIACLVACSGPPAKPNTPAPRPTAIATLDAGGPQRMPPVAAPRRPVVHEFFGTKVTDDYEWLEDGKSPEVKAFVDGQNALARKHIDGLSDRAAVRARLASLYGSGAADWNVLTHVDGTVFAVKHAPPKQQSMLIAFASVDPDPKAERVICDPNAIDPSGKTTIDFFVPSPDKKLVAVSLSKDGTESGDVHVFDVATGKETGDVIARVNGGTAGGSVAWNEAGTAFWYTRYPRAGERPEADLDFFQQVWFHKLGTPESADTYAMGKDLPRIAEIELVRSEDGKSILARVANGDGGEVEHHVLFGGKWIGLSRFEDELSTAVFAPDGKVIAVSRKGAPRGKVIAFAPPFDAPAVELVSQSDAVVEDVVATKSALYTIELVGGPSRVRRFPLSTKPEPLARETKPPPKPARKGAPPPPPPPGPVTIAAGARGPAAAELPLPPVSSVERAVRVGEDLFLRIESFVDPPAWYRYRASEHRLVKTALERKAAFDMKDVEVLRETCTSKDATKVPMSILRPRGVKLDGNLPVLLTGYGGFGVSRKPHLRTWYRAFLDQGGVIVETNLRGGGELGEEWHRAGRLTKKQNVFDDYAACAKAVVDLGYTKPARLAGFGRSNGGLLMGAAIVQHPEMFRVIVSGVGIYDMLRTELSQNGAFNVTEFGTVKDEAQFRAMYAYSPLHNVKDGTAYPAILFVTGANDPRVDPYQSRKMVARLQVATSADRPIVLRASADTGHGGGTPLSAQIEEYTDMLAFLFKELEVPFRAPAAK